MEAVTQKYLRLGVSGPMPARIIILQASNFKLQASTVTWPGSHFRRDNGDVYTENPVKVKDVGMYCKIKYAERCSTVPVGVDSASRCVRCDGDENEL